MPGRYIPGIHYHRHMNQTVTIESENIAQLLSSAYKIRVNNLKQSIDLAEKALSLSRDQENIPFIAQSLNYLSLFYMIQGEYKKATECAEEALEYFNELKDEKGIADVKYNLAGVYYKTDNYHLGLTHLLDCLGTYRHFNDYHNQARVHKSLGTIYEYFGDFKNAVKSYQQSIDAAIKAGDVNLESNGYNPLSGIFLKQGRVEEALHIIERAISLKESSGDRRGLAFALYGRAKVYTHALKYAEAEADFKNALKIHLESGERLGTGMAYRKLGALYAEMGEREKAKEAFGQALAISKEYNIAIIRFKTYYHLYQLHKNEGNDELALSYLEEYITYKESVITTQTLQVIENYELIAQVEAIEKENQLQREKAEILEKKNRVEQAFKVRQEFLSTMSHEIRTPLNAVIMISSLLKDKSDPEEQQLLTSLKFAANNLLLIINDILDFTKLDSGKAVLESRPCKLTGLLENIRNTYDSLAKEKGLELNLVTDGLAAAYEIDETKISQILGNIISNAIKYTDTGKVDVLVNKIMRDEDYDLVSFRVIDTGPGISESYLPQIFDSFSQEQYTNTRKQGGSGLGLAIVKKLVQLHGSEVFVTSQMCVGSEFYFDLRLKRAEVPGKAETRNLDQLKGKTVLLAEDNLVNAMVAVKLLKNWGMIPQHAKNGLEVVEMSLADKYDFILMDLHMPEMNGFDATKAIRQMANPNNATLIFALTADITADQQEDYISLFSGFLKKPIEIDKMYDALHLS